MRLTARILLELLTLIMLITPLILLWGRALTRMHARVLAGEASSISGEYEYSMDGLRIKVVIYSPAVEAGKNKHVAVGGGWWHG